MHILPIHNKSKTIHFINSPKLWTKNFLAYLEENHRDLYLIIMNVLNIIKNSIITLLIICVLYLIGYNVFPDIDKLIEETGMASYVIIPLLGLALCLAICGVFMFTTYFIDITIEILFNLYDVTRKFIMALQQYIDTDKTNADV